MREYFPVQSVLDAMAVVRICEDAIDARVYSSAGSAKLVVSCVRAGSCRGVDVLPGALMGIEVMKATPRELRLSGSRIKVDVRNRKAGAMVMAKMAELFHMAKMKRKAENVYKVQTGDLRCVRVSKKPASVNKVQWKAKAISGKPGTFRKASNLAVETGKRGGVCVAVKRKKSTNTAKR